MSCSERAVTLCPAIHPQSMRRERRGQVMPAKESQTFSLPLLHLRDVTSCLLLSQPSERLSERRERHYSSKSPQTERHFSSLPLVSLPSRPFFSQNHCLFLPSPPRPTLSASLSHHLAISLSLPSPETSFLATLLHPHPLPRQLFFASLFHLPASSVSVLFRQTSTVLPRKCFI